MADVTVSPFTKLLHTQAVRVGPVWTDNNIGYVVLKDSFNDMAYRKTADGGATWGDDVDIEGGGNGNVRAFDIWFDKWTPGDSGTLIHIWWHDAVTNDIEYRTLDTSDDSLGTLRLVFDGATFNTGQDRDNRLLSGAKAVGGNLYVQFWGDVDGERGFYRSVDAGVNWTSRTDGADGNEPDEVLCLPDDDSADNEDIVMIYWDRSADELSIKKYDDSGNSWGETSISTGMVDSVGSKQMSAVVRHSDGHIIVAAWSDIDVGDGTADLRVWDIALATPTVTSKADVVQNSDDCVGVALHIDQNNDDLYCAYLGDEDGSETWQATLTAFTKKITAADFAADNAWGSQTAYQEGAADDSRYISAGHSTPGGAAGRFEPVWFNDDISDLYVNKVNSVELGAAGGTDRVGTLSFSELEAPLGLRRGQLSFGELETALGPRAGVLSFAEVEVPTEPSLSLQVAAGTDDAEQPQTGAGFTATSAGIRMNADADPSLRFQGGYRFTGVTIPQGAVIDSAVIQLSNSDANANPTCEISAEDVDDAVDFVTNPDIRERVMTTERTSWLEANIPVGFRDSPSIAPLVQEIVDRPLWVSGNSIVLLVKGTGASGLFKAISYDGTPANAAKLVITYTVGTDRAGTLSFGELEVPLGLRRGQLSFGELEMALGQRTGVLSYGELEIPTAPRIGQVSFAELESPLTPRRGLLSYGEQEIPALNRRGRLSFGEVEAALAPRRGTLSFGEQEVPIAPRAGTLTYSELEIPIAPRRGRLSYAETEVPTAPRRGHLSYAEVQTDPAPRSGQFSFAEVEVAIAPRAGQLSFAELQLDLAPRVGTLSFAELELPLTPRVGRLSYGELQTPDTGRRGVWSWSELEAPLSPRRAWLSFAELEFPDVSRRGILTFTEMEIAVAPRIGRLGFAELELLQPPRQGYFSFTVLEVPQVIRRGLLSFGELEVPTIVIADRNGIVSFTELEVPELFIDIIPVDFRPQTVTESLPMSVARPAVVWMLGDAASPSDYSFAAPLNAGDTALTNRGELWLYNGKSWKLIVTE